MNPIVTPEPTVDPYYRAFGHDFVTAPLSEVLAATAEENWIRNPTPTIFRAIGRAEAERTGVGGRRPPVEFTPAPRFTAEEANAKYGIEGELSFDSPVPERTAADLHAMKLAEIRRRDVLSRAGGGLGQALLRFGVGFGVSALDPLNIASAFIPVLGPERAAALLARAGSSAFARAGMRAGIGAIEGGVGAAALEPIVYAGARAEQADYTMADSLLNLAFGTLLGGGLHVLGGAVADRFSLRGNSARIAALPIEQKRDLLGAGVAQLAEGRPVEVHDLAAAYDRVRDRPLGPPDDPSVAVRVSDLERVLVERGPVIERGGEMVIPNRGYGLVKVLLRHGELSAKDPAFRVTREDVLAFPQVLADYEPVSSRGAPGEAQFTREWRVQRPGPDGAPREIVYAVSRFSGTDNQDRLVTVYVAQPHDKLYGRLSRKREAGGAGSPGPVVSAPGDTAAGTFDRPPQGRASPASGGPGTTSAPTAAAEGPLSIRPDRGPGAAEGNIGAFRAADNPEEAIPAAAEAAVKEAERLEAAGPARQIQELETVTSAEVKALKESGRLTPEDLAELEAADKAAAAAEARAKALEAGAACLGGEGA